MNVTKENNDNNNNDWPSVCVGVGKCNVSFEGIAFGREGARQH